MSLKAKLMKLESEIESLKDGDLRLERLEIEANNIAEQISFIEEQDKVQNELEIKAKLQKLNEIISLGKEGKWDILFNKYGSEFVDDYSIQDNKVISHVAKPNQNDEWEVKNPDKKLRQLVGWRIYDHYRRGQC